MAGGEKVTVNERLLVHLREAWIGQPAPTPAATQGGIARALGIRANHVSRSVATLLREGLVEETTARVRGEVRRRKVYSLSSSGRELADRLYGDVARRPVTVEEGNRSSRITVESATRLPNGPRTVTGVLTALREGSVLRPGDTKRKGAVALALVEVGLPPPEALVGRDVERAALQTWHASSVSILSVVGPRGVGKTALLAGFFRKAAESSHAFWKTLGPEDGPVSLAPILSAFLDKIGRSARGSAPVPLSAVLDQRLRGQEALLLFDGLDDASPETKAWVTGVATSAAKAGAKTILIADKPVREWQALRTRGVLQELRLEGLTVDEARLLLGPSLPDDQLRRLHRLAAGNPLALRLAGLSWKESTGADLSDSERTLLSYLRATN